MLMLSFASGRNFPEEVIPPVLLGVPGSMLGIEVPYLPSPGRLHVVPYYDCRRFADHTSIRGMRWACCMGQSG